MSKRTINRKQDLLMESLTDFFTSDNVDYMLPIVNGNSNISLRIIDWFVTNYAKKNNISYYTNHNMDVQEGGEILQKTITKQFIVYLNYKSQLKAYSKKQFDPFCRRERISFYYDKDNELVTTVGQLNFFRWAIENHVLDYIGDNLEEIEKDMNQSVRSLYNKRNKSKKKNMKKNGGSGEGSKKQRRKRQELSVNATKSVSKHNVKILVKFE
jgi:hypothetical protein